MLKSNHKKNQNSQIFQKLEPVTWKCKEWICRIKELQSLSLSWSWQDVMEEHRKQ